MNIELKSDIGEKITTYYLKKLPKDSFIHLWYIDNDGRFRYDDFIKFDGYYGYHELSATGFALPTEGHSDDELIENFDNCGWTFTVRETIKK